MDVHLGAASTLSRQFPLGKANGPTKKATGNDRVVIESGVGLLAREIRLAMTLVVKS